MSNFSLPIVWWQEHRASFEWWGALVKMPTFNAFSRNLNTVNMKIFLTHGGIHKFKGKFNKHSVERYKALGSLQKYECMYPLG